MSYSRWSNSFWYTYWSSESGETRDEQVFEICDLACPLSFTYAELKGDLTSCLQVVYNENNQERKGKLLSEVIETEDGNEYIYKDVVYPPRLIDLDEMLELAGYMKEFMRLNLLLPLETEEFMMENHLESIHS